MQRPSEGFGFTLILLFVVAICLWEWMVSRNVQANTRGNRALVQQQADADMLQYYAARRKWQERLRRIDRMLTELEEQDDE